MIVKVEKVQREDIFNHIVVKPCTGEKAEKPMGVRMTDREMERFLSKLGLRYKKQLVGSKMYLTKYSNVYGLIELDGEVEGDTQGSIDGIVRSLSGKDGKCIWKITDGNSVITVTTEHEAVRGVERALDCVFPWELQGKAAIFNANKVYIMCKII